MTDTFDQAQATEALETDAALRAQQLRAALAPRVDPTGECLNPLCGEPVESPKLFCNANCAQEHARRSK
jgi:hypothetical protein